MSKTWFCFVAVVAAVVVLGGCTTTSRMNKEIAAREDQITQLQADIEETNDTLSERDASITEQQSEIESLQQELDKLNAAIEEEAQRAGQLNTDLAQALGDLEDKEKVYLENLEGLSTITMPSGATFASGSATLTDEGKEIIDTIWEVLSRYPDRDIFIDGHTDSIPIGPVLSQRFPSNWALSTARAVAVLQYVLSKYEAEAQRLGAVGYGEYRPLATNSTEEGRTLNRRVVVSVRPRAE
jgi:chemotaxis protein MotB